MKKLGSNAAENLLEVFVRDRFALARVYTADFVL